MRKQSAVVCVCVRFVGHNEFDRTLRKIFEETKLAVMMALFKVRDAEPGQSTTILEVEPGVRKMIFNAVFCDTTEHPYIIEDGVRLQRECSLQLCGRTTKQAAFPCAVLSVPLEGMVYDDVAVAVQGAGASSQ